MKIAIVTATTNPARAEACIKSWRTNAVTKPLIIGVINEPSGSFGPGLFDVGMHALDYLGTVPAFQRGVNHLLEWNEPPDIIACLHDDFEIHESRWDEKVLRHFERHPTCGLLGFGGATGLGSDRLYQDPYDPMQLARIGFRSNLVDAEVHGTRSLLPERVACLDGFSQVGRKEFWLGHVRNANERGEAIHLLPIRPWDVLHELGVTHHFYDGMLGCLAARYGWETWYLPLRGKHWGGQTAVGDAGYSNWAKTQTEGGDHGFWEAAHRAGYEAFRDVLPLRV